MSKGSIEWHIFEHQIQRNNFHSSTQNKKKLYLPLVKEIYLKKWKWKSIAKIKKSSKTVRQNMQEVHKCIFLWYPITKSINVLLQKKKIIEVIGRPHWNNVTDEIAHYTVDWNRFCKNIESLAESDGCYISYRSNHREIKIPLFFLLFAEYIPINVFIVFKIHILDCKKKRERGDP